MDERQQYDILFGSRLDDLREERGLTKAELWKAVGVSNNTGRGYLQGKVEPTLYIIYKLCQALGCSADDLVDPEIACWIFPTTSMHRTRPRNSR